MNDLPGNLRRALKKSKPFHNCWCGYLTPSEIVALVKDGHRAKHEPWVDYAKEKMKRGESNPTYFYFYATGKHRPEHPNLGRHDKTKSVPIQ